MKIQRVSFHRVARGNPYRTPNALPLMVTESTCVGFDPEAIIQGEIQRYLDDQVPFLDIPTKYRYEVERRRIKRAVDSVGLDPLRRILVKLMAAFDDASLGGTSKADKILAVVAELCVHSGGHGDIKSWDALVKKVVPSDLIPEKAAAKNQALLRVDITDRDADTPEFADRTNYMADEIWSWCTLVTNPAVVPERDFLLEAEPLFINGERHYGELLNGNWAIDTQKALRDRVALRGQQILPRPVCMAACIRGMDKTHLDQQGRNCALPCVCASGNLTASYVKRGHFDLVMYIDIKPAALGDDSGTTGGKPKELSVAAKLRFYHQQMKALNKHIEWVSREGFFLEIDGKLQHFFPFLPFNIVDFPGGCDNMCVYKVYLAQMLCPCCRMLTADFGSSLEAGDEPRIFDPLVLSQMSTAEAQANSVHADVENAFSMTIGSSAGATPFGTPANMQEALHQKCEGDLKVTHEAVVESVTAFVKGRGLGVAANAVKFQREIKAMKGAMKRSDRRFAWYTFEQSNVLSGTYVKAQERACLLLQTSLATTAIVPYGRAAGLISVAVAAIKSMNILRKLEPVQRSDSTKRRGLAYSGVFVDEVEEAQEAFALLLKRTFVNDAANRDERGGLDAPATYTKTGWCNVKQHANVHYPAHMRLFGFPTMWDTAASENAWIVWAKELFGSTQRRSDTFTLQMLHRALQRKLVRRLIDAQTDYPLEHVAPASSEGGVIGFLELNFSGTVLTVGSDRPGVNFMEHLSKAECTILFMFIKGRPWIEAAGAMSVDGAARRQLRPEEVLGAINRRRFKVLGDIIVRDVEVPMRVRFHPLFNGQPWENDFAWYCASAGGRRLCRVRLIVEFDVRERFVLVQMYDLIRSVTGEMPLPVYRRTNTVIVLAAGRLQEPAMTCKCPAEFEGVSNDDGADDSGVERGLVRIDPKTDVFFLDPERFGIPRSNDAIRLAGDLRRI
jgi:hypothetical protein